MALAHRSSVSLAWLRPWMAVDLRQPSYATPMLLLACWVPGRGISLEVVGFLAPLRLGGEWYGRGLGVGVTILTVICWVLVKSGATLGNYAVNGLETKERVNCRV